MRTVIGLGANLGDRMAALREAVARLADVGAVLAKSDVCETDPVGGPDQPRYLNAAVLFATELGPTPLMRRLLAVEAAIGRVRTGERNHPRVIDLDVLWIENVAVWSELVVVPHPRLEERAFALGPLLELVPGARDPTTGRVYTLAEADRCPSRWPESWMT